MVKTLADLGPAAVDVSTLAEIVGSLLGADVAEVRDVRVSPVDYDVPAITTAARHWVRGQAVVATGSRDGDDVRSWGMFVKQVQAWERHPFFAFVPPEHRELARQGVPWRAEPDAYRSDLVDRLPPGLTMPRAVAVTELDELSAAVWLPELTVVERPWDDERYAAAARLLGRFAASTRVREVAEELGHRITPWTYLHGRLSMQVLPGLADDDLWRHPLLADAFGPIQTRLRAAAARAEPITAELCDAHVLAAHGDAAPGNLLSVAGLDEVVLIDFGFFGPLPVGFDLAQLLVGEVQLGHDPGEGLAERDAACVAAYCQGLADEGVSIDPDVVRRAHALQLVLYAGLSAVPFELLGQPPTPELLALAAARARVAELSLDLLDATEPRVG